MHIIHVDELRGLLVLVFQTYLLVLAWLGGSYWDTYTSTWVTRLETPTSSSLL